MWQLKSTTPCRRAKTPAQGDCAMTTNKTLCNGVTEQEVEAIEALGWMEGVMRLNDQRGQPFNVAGFFKGPLHLHQSEKDHWQEDLWVLGTVDFVAARLPGPVTNCISFADRILALTDWSALNERAKRGKRASKKLGTKVRKIMDEAWYGEAA
jgi:hypothetical protein